LGDGKYGFVKGWREFAREKERGQVIQNRREIPPNPRE
jgi:hypothetical protein